MNIEAVNLQYAADLMRKHYEAVGFIPAPKLAAYASVGQLFEEMENGEPCGYVVFGNGWPTLRIYQALIQYDAQRREHGLSLVARVMKRAEQRGCHAVSLWCANDLPSNEFWVAAGFNLIGQRAGGVRRGRVHNHWVRPCITPQLGLL